MTTVTFVVGLTLAVSGGIDNKLKEEFNKRQLKIYDHATRKERGGCKKNTNETLKIENIIR